uniref:ORF43g n=1 Tax=Pinus koraiensis TaxID=88728 RepID=A4QM36_PINKO|nr:ORF43g [Pinus koraiensis]ABP35365.1 ORF43g [Pinus koraiensis]
MVLQVCSLALICGAQFCSMWVVAIISSIKKKELYVFFVGDFPE